MLGGSPCPGSSSPTSHMLCSHLSCGIPGGLGLRPPTAGGSLGRRHQGWGQRGHSPSLPEGEDLAWALDLGVGWSQETSWGLGPCCPEHARLLISSSPIVGSKIGLPNCLLLVAIRLQLGKA